MDVHLRDLRYFLAVARELSFTRAAETLYISQPALSKQIRALERQLRVALFVREQTGARLSRAGTCAGGAASGCRSPSGWSPTGRPPRPRSRARATRRSCLGCTRAPAAG